MHGTDPYVVPVRLHHAVKYHPPGQPDFEGFLPYLPLMAVAGVTFTAANSLMSAIAGTTSEHDLV